MVTIAIIVGCFGMVAFVYLNLAVVSFLKRDLKRTKILYNSYYSFLIIHLSIKTVSLLFQ